MLLGKIIRIISSIFMEVRSKIDVNPVIVIRLDRSTYLVDCIEIFSYTILDHVIALWLTF